MYEELLHARLLIDLVVPQIWLQWTWSHKGYTELDWMEYILIQTQGGCNLILSKPTIDNRLNAWNIWTLLPELGMYNA